MRTFAAVVAAGSFTAAAERLGISTNLASKYVARLEARLGARLLNRTTRSLSLTELGRAYYDRCQQLVDGFDELEAAIRDRQAALRGTLRITAPATFGEMFLTAPVAEFVDAHPQISLDLTLTDRYVDLIDDGFDLAIRIGTLSDSSLIARRLAATHAVVCAAPDYLAARGTPADPEALRDHDCIIDTNQRSGAQWPFTVNGTPMAVKVDGRLRVNSARAARSLALDGAGIALCPSYVVGADIQAGRLRAVLTDFQGSDWGIYALYPHTRYLAPKLRRFVDFLATHFAGRTGSATV